MHSFNRRSVIKTAGLAMGSAAWVPAFGSTETAATSKTANAFFPPSVPFSPDLSSWTDHRVSQSLAHILNGGHGTREHFHNAGAAMRMMANHFTETGIDLAVKFGARRVNVSKLQTRQHTTRSNVLGQLQQYVPHLKNDDLSDFFPDDPAILESTRKRVAKSGISFQYHAAADVMQTLAQAMPKTKKVKHKRINHAVNSLHGPVLMDVNYYPQPPFLDPAAMGEVSLSSLGAACKAALCKILSNPTINDAIAAAIAVTVSITEDFGATFFCGLDLGSSALIDVLTEGNALLLAPLEAELCAGAQAGAAWYKLATGVSSGVAAGALIRQMQKSLGCPAGG